MIRKLLKRQRRYTEAEVTALIDQAIHTSGQRFTEILGRASAKVLTEEQRAALADAWDFECSQDAAHHRADTTKGE